ncbi:MAG: T9SS type A sorting domain-containing protein, partial [Chryseobacterium sp.]
SSNKSVSNLLLYGEKIYIAGRIDADSYIISSNMDGTYNTDFNNDGRYILDVGGKTNTIDQLLIVNNIIYAFGNSQASSTSVYTTCISALNIDGSIAAFGIDGSSEFLNTSSNPTVLKVIPKENGKMLLIVGGDFYMINRYGNPDTTFGNQGKIVNPHNQSFTSCAVASDNGFYFSKFKYLQTTTQMVFYTVKINAEFGKSTNFGSGGEITTNVSYPKYSEQIPSKLLSSADGKLVVAGTVTRYPNPNVPSIKNQDYVVLRYGDPSVLSANNDNSKSEISIYPNPAKNIISIRSKDKILKIVLFDATGKLLKSFTGSETKQINVANMTRGNYILKIYTKDKVTTQKIIKE